ncbi:MAG: hypothetical protein ACM3WV_07155 [Bacillota bacterium]
MGHFVRVFCASPLVPPVRKVIEWAAQKGCKLKMDPDTAPADQEKTDWRRVGIIYKDNHTPFYIEVNMDDDSGSHLREEIDEYSKFLNNVDDSSDKNKALQHLRKTKFIVSNEIPAQFADEGYLALGVFLTYFVQHCDGMIQVDGEGIKQKLKVT